jgi:MFS family permease
MTAAATPAPGGSGWRARYPALTYPNYRLWFVGQMVSMFGTWMQSTAQGYLIFQLTKSPAYLGYVAFAGGLPTWIFTLYGGVIADRVPRRTLMIITQSAMMVLAFILGILTFTNLVQPWHIIVLAFLLGVANAFDAPARQAFTLEMVERKDLANAIALNATMFNSATALGPAMGGLVYSLVGPGWCFVLNGLSFIAVIVALLLMKLKPFVAPVLQRSTASALREGLGYVRRQKTVLTLMVMIGIVSLFGLSFATLMPVWAVDVLGGDATTNGLLQSARGLGALIGALSIASLGRFNYKGRLLTAGTFALPIMLLIFSQTRLLPASLILLVGIGLSQIPIMNMANALVQILVPDALRGRVMGVYTLFFFGAMPIGGLWAGTVAHYLGAPATIAIGAVIVLATASAIFVFLPHIRRLE